MAAVWGSVLAAVLALLGAGFGAAGFESRLNGFCRAESNDEVADGFWGLVSARAVADASAFGFAGVAGFVSACGCWAAEAFAPASDWEPDAWETEVWALAAGPAAGLAAMAPAGVEGEGVGGWFCCGKSSHAAAPAVECEGAVVVVGVGSMVSGACATVLPIAELPSAELLARVAGVSTGIDAVATAVGSGVETAAAVGVDAGGGITASAAGGSVGGRMVLSRNDAAMADSDPLAGTPSSLAKSESMRTLAATALIALPPGGTVPRTSAVVAARRPLPFSLPKVGSADPLPEMSANSRRLTAGSGVPWDDDRVAVAEARAASCAARAAAATNPAGVSGTSNFVSNCSSVLRMQAVGTFVMPRRRVASGFASTSTQTGSKQAPMRATASSLASVVRSRVVVAELQLAVKIASTGRWLISAARRAVARSGCHGMAADALAVHAENSVSAATVASRRQIREGVGIGITMQVEDITPASGPCGPHWDNWHQRTPGTEGR